MVRDNDHSRHPHFRLTVLNTSNNAPFSHFGDPAEDQWPLQLQRPQVALLQFVAHPVTHHFFPPIDLAVSSLTSHIDPVGLLQISRRCATSDAAARAD